MQVITELLSGQSQLLLTLLNLFLIKLSQNVLILDLLKIIPDLSMKYFFFHFEEVELC